MSLCTHRRRRRLAVECYTLLGRIRGLYEEVVFEHVPL